MSLVDVMRNEKGMDNKPLFIQNPNTKRWLKASVQMVGGELPTTFMSEQTYWYGNIYIRRK